MQGDFIAELYHKYYSYLLSYCTAKLGDEDEALDCVNEVFQTAEKNKEKLKAHINIVGWLKKTASNRVMRALRKRGYRQKHEVFISDISERYMEQLQYLESFDEKNAAFEGIFSEKDEAIAKEAVLSKLLPEERNLYELRYTQGYTIKEVAKRIKMSDTATRMRIVRLDLKLKQEIAAYDFTNNSHKQRLE